MSSAHRRPLPSYERAAQGSSHVGRTYTQFDGYVQCELRRVLPWLTKREGLRVQLRVDNLFNARFPYYANDSSGAGLQCYGDWRGQTYSLSFTATL